MNLVMGVGENRGQTSRGRNKWNKLSNVLAANEAFQKQEVARLASADFLEKELMRTRANEPDLSKQKDKTTVVECLLSS